MKIWSKAWNSSKKPKKQRKYKYNAPSQVRRKIMSSHLSKQLIQKYNIRSLPVRLGDKVKIMRGEFKGKEGEVERINRQRYSVNVKGITKQKKDGASYKVPISSSNLCIIELKDDKRRIKERKTKETNIEVKEKQKVK